MNINKVKVTSAYHNKVLYFDDVFRVEYFRGKLLFIKYENTIIFQMNVDTSRVRQLLARFFCTERLLRLEPRTILRQNVHTFILPYNGEIFRINAEEGTIETIFSFLNGTRSPLHYCQYIRNGINEVVFGDYNGRDSNDYVGIYRLIDRNVERIGTIKGSIINHIHRVEYDYYRDCYWIFTGDSDHGSGIWTMDYNTRVIEPFLVGSQDYRACVAYIGKEKITYATDSPNNPNKIYSLDIKRKTLRIVYELPGPCIYGFKSEKSSQMVFATSVEPDSTLRRARYLITRRLGSGVKDRYSHIICGSIEDGFKEIYKLKKDILPMLLFQFGNVRFPNQCVPNKVLFCPQSCHLPPKKYKTYIIDVLE